MACGRGRAASERYVDEPDSRPPSPALPAMAVLYGATKCVRPLRISWLPPSTTAWLTSHPYLPSHTRRRTPGLPRQKRSGPPRGHATGRPKPADERQDTVPEIATRRRSRGIAARIERLQRRLWDACSQEGTPSLTSTGGRSRRLLGGSASASGSTGTRDSINAKPRIGSGPEGGPSYHNRHAPRQRVWPRRREQIRHDPAAVPVISRARREADYR